MADLSFMAEEVEGAGASAEQVEEIKADRDLGRRMLEGYFASRRGEFAEWETLATETFFEVPLRRRFEPFLRSQGISRSRAALASGRISGWNHGGVVDLVQRHRRDGRFRGTDHKFYAPGSWSDFNNTLLLDDQISGYFVASFDPLFRNSMHIPGGEGFNEFRFNILIKQAPREPETLKAGGLSVDKRQITTAEIYRAKLAALGLACEGKYADFVAMLEANPRTFFHATTIVRTPEDMDRWCQEQSKKVREMKKGEVYKNPQPRVCPRCVFKTICERDTPEARELFEKRDNPHEEIKAPRREPTRELLTYSRSSSFGQCRQEHDLSYNQRLKSRTRARYFRFGDVGHKALAVWYSTEGNDQKAFEAFDLSWKAEYLAVTGQEWNPEQPKLSF